MSVEIKVCRLTDLVQNARLWYIKHMGTKGRIGPVLPIFGTCTHNYQEYSNFVKISDTFFVKSQP